jgi:dihydroorotate dehydrogenase electron transfer subunit
VLNPESTLARVCGCAARVVANQPVCREHREIELLAPDLPESAPGQFLQLRCAPAVQRRPRILEWNPGGFPSHAEHAQCDAPHAFLHRPFSIADRWRDADGASHVVIISRTVGRGTAWLEQLKPGETLDVTGPLGRGFSFPADAGPSLLIGGGVGIPPLLYLARILDESGRHDVTAIFGATTRALLPLRLSSEPSAAGRPLPCAELAGSSRFPTVITTDDGSLGMRGVVTDALRAWHAGLGGGPARGGQVFTCGPTAMLRAVAEATRELGLDCQMCIERMMGCGLGTCLSCVVRVRDPDRPDGWRWALTCSDGPVFDRDELLDTECDTAAAVG